MERWLESRVADGEVGIRASANYRGILANRINPALGHLRLVDIEADDVRAFKAELVGAGLAAATVGKVLGLLQQALDAAVEGNVLAVNPASLVRKPSLAGATVDRRALNEDELSKLLVAAEGTQYATAIRLAVATGMRQSELLGLRWVRVDFEKSTIQVTETLQHAAGRFRILPTKSKNSVRSIELSLTAVALLRRHRSAQLEERLRIGTLWADHDLVLPGPDGSPQHRRTFLAGYRRLVTSSGISEPESVDWHSLRHTSASLWIKAGVDVFVVSRRLGHAKASFTMDVYGHLLPGQQGDAARATDRIIMR